MSNYFDRELYNEDFTTLDSQLGYSVVVNGVNLYTLCYADLISYDLVPAKINYNSFKNVGKSSYFLNQYKNNDNGVKFSFYVGGDSYQNAQLNVNKLINAFQSNAPVIVKIGDTDFEYVCILTDVSINDTDVFHYYKVVLTTIAVKRFALISSTFGSSAISSGITITNQGTIPSGILLFLSTSKTSNTIQIRYGQNNVFKTITINNANLYSYHVIDGIDGRVLRGASYSTSFTNYVNNFGNVDLYEFPVVRNGANQINFIQTSGDITQLTVKYYPVFHV